MFPTLSLYSRSMFCARACSRWALSRGIAAHFDGNRQAKQTVSLSSQFGTIYRSEGSERERIRSS
jgi:hypothetical protein